MSEISIAHAARRAGLNRDQVIYIERQGYLGDVVRRGRTRYFTEAQVRKLEHIAAFRLMGLRLNEAAPLCEDIGRTPEERRRLWTLAARKAAEIHRDLSAWIYVTRVLDAEANPSELDAA